MKIYCQKLNEVVELDNETELKKRCRRCLENDSSNENELCSGVRPAEEDPENKNENEDEKH